MLFGAIGFVVGYIQQNFRTTFLILAFGSCIAAVVRAASAVQVVPVAERAGACRSACPTGHGGI